MNDSKELIKNISGDAAFQHVISECGADGRVWFDKKFICDYVSHLKCAIEQLARKCGAEESGMCKFRITGFESSESWESYQYYSDAPVDVTVFAKSKKEAIEKAEKIIGCPISITNRHIVVQEVEHERKNAD